MSKLALALIATFACAGNAQPPSKTQTLAELLLTGEPAAAFNPSGARKGLLKFKPAQQRTAEPTMEWSMERALARNNQLQESDALPCHMYAQNVYSNEDAIFQKDPMKYLEQKSSDMGPAYGRALWFAVEGEDRQFQDKVAEDFDAYASFLEDADVFNNLLINKNILLSEKFKVIDTFGDSRGAADILKELIKGMFKENRWEWFRTASETYADYVVVGNKEQTVEVTTSSEDLLPEIEAKAKDMITPGFTPIFSYKVDPSMETGGYKIKIDEANEYNFCAQERKSASMKATLDEALPLITRVLAKAKLEALGWTEEDFKTIGVE